MAFDLDDEKYRATRKLNGVEWEEDKEIQVGDYVRTKNGKIRKLISVVAQYYILDKFDITEKSQYELKDIIKHSKNIIDILEDKDFVKIEFYSPRYQERVTRIFEISRLEDKYITFENIHCDLFMVDGKWVNHDERLKPIIKSVVTHEQFNSIMYRVEE